MLTQVITHIFGSKANMIVPPVFTVVKVNKTVNTKKNFLLDGNNHPIRKNIDTIKHIEEEDGRAEGADEEPKD